MRSAPARSWAPEALVVVADASLELMPLEEALARMLRGARPLPVEETPVEQAVGRVLAHELRARTALPPWDNSAMDGFAVRSADTARASQADPIRLSVIGEVAAGHAPTVEVRPGTSVRILTGAMLPTGADAVVPVEDTDAAPGVAALPPRVLVASPVAPGASVRRRGSDLAEGAPLLPHGHAIRPAGLALLVAGGYATVPVHRRPRLAVLPTGDELAVPGTRLGPGQIHDSNGPMLVAQARQAGADARLLPAAADRLETVVAAVSAALRWADAIVVSGGVSVGAHDVVRDAFERLGRVELWRVAVQPGKPLCFGWAGETALFGLPGNPVSSYVTFEIFVQPLLRALAGEPQPTRRSTTTARLGTPITKDRARRAFLRVTLDHGRAGGPVAHLAGGQGSHVLSALAAAEGLAVVPEGIERLDAGAEVEVWLLDGGGCR